MDFVVFSIITLSVFALVTLFLVNQCGTRRLAAVVGVITCSLLATTYFALEWAGEHAKSQMRDGFLSMLSTYARETELLEHSKIDLKETAPDSPIYLKIVEAQKRWESLNSHVSGIYTWRLLGEKQLAFVVDSETDYDRSGAIDDEREQRTPIGEVYENEVTPEQLRAFNNETVVDEVTQTDKWGTWISGYAPLHDPSGKVEACLGIDMSAALWLSRIREIRLAVLGYAGALLILVGAFGAGFGWLRAHTRRKEDANALLERLVAERTSALKAQNHEFELEIQARGKMQEDLTRAQEKLITASRQAGMAEVAASVLHNVGNVLNSANVSTQVLVETLGDIRIERVSEMAEMIRTNSENATEFFATPRGKAIPAYLTTLAGHEQVRREKLIIEAKRIQENLEHIRQVISRQQAVARCSGSRELLDPCDLMEQALSLSGHALGAAGVKIVRDYQNVGRAWLDKHLILQILVNLIGNAKHALAASSGSDKRVTLRVISPEEGGIRITVEDNGVGISAENLARLFSFGFTTKKEGNGFGLHHSANTAKELGGKLSVTSLGEGLGATFYLDFPVEAVMVTMAEAA
jgi:C4-dicarboxylate-specific signal transduction histidine kinase